MRKIEALSFPGAELAEPRGQWPEFISVAPATLLVEEEYQRHITERGRALIRRIAVNPDWSRFTPPKVAHVEAGLAVVDGQHTAIGLASNPHITTIPVQVTWAEELAGRAADFVAINRDRIALTAWQLHHAAVAAGDDEAVTIAQVCAKVGVRILRVQAASDAWLPGETLAIGAIKTLVAKRHPHGARVVLKALFDARLAPITAKHVKAVDALLNDAEFKGKLEPDRIAVTLAAHASSLDKDGDAFAATHGCPQWKGLAASIFRKARSRG